LLSADQRTKIQHGKIEIADPSAWDEFIDGRPHSFVSMWPAPIRSDAEDPVEDACNGRIKEPDPASEAKAGNGARRIRADSWNVLEPVWVSGESPVQVCGNEVQSFHQDMGPLRPSQRP
jgi:hypothetical protein